MASKRILVTYNNSETLLRCFSPNDDCCPYKNKSIEDGDHGILFLNQIPYFQLKFHLDHPRLRNYRRFVDHQRQYFHLK